MIKQKIKALRRLKEKLQKKDSKYLGILERAEIENRWFTQNHIQHSVDAICKHYLNEEELTKWLSSYSIQDQSAVRVGLILAGNIPLVGFHDILCCFLVNAHTKIKLSEKDTQLTQYMVQTLQSLDAAWRVEIVEKLSDFDAAIATGSNNTNRYFEYYFRTMPSILRKNRTSLAILNGQESEDELCALGTDICLYFGLGCRNVSAIFVPKGYDVTQIFDGVAAYQYLHQHKLYMDNYDYNRTLLLMNNVPHLANDFLLMKEDPSLQARLATIHYQYYSNEQEIQDYIIDHADQIQVVVGKESEWWSSVPFGESQSPALCDYADEVDTMKFLSEL